MKSNSPIVSGGPFGNPAAELLQTLDSGITCADLAAMPTDRLCNLSSLLDHWGDLANHQLEQRAALLHRQAG